ncbi:MAG: ChaN family lipoprotein, partial [Thiolinea sp.]
MLAGERELSFAEFSQELAKPRVVFVGEQHDRYDHHLNQLAILRALHAQNPKLAIGLEWFQQPFQAVLDDWLASKLSDAELLKQSDYYQRWRFDFRMLRPILEYAKVHQLLVLALNAPSELTRKVAEGGLDSLSAEERAQLPAEITPPQPAYRDYLQQVFAEHGQGSGNLERFISVQRIWDETMAANAVAFLQQHPDYRLLVLAGSGHTGRGVAIPADVARRLPEAGLATVFSSERERIK